MFLRAFSSFSGCLHIVVTNHEPPSNEEASFTKILIYWLLFIFLSDSREKALLKSPQKNPHEQRREVGEKGQQMCFAISIKYVSVIHNSELLPTCDWSKFANSLLWLLLCFSLSSCCFSYIHFLPLVFFDIFTVSGGQHWHFHTSP